MSLFAGLAGASVVWSWVYMCVWLVYTYLFGRLLADQSNGRRCHRSWPKQVPELYRNDRLHPLPGSEIRWGKRWKKAFQSSSHATVAYKILRQKICFFCIFFLQVYTRTEELWPARNGLVLTLMKWSTQRRTVSEALKQQTASHFQNRSDFTSLLVHVSILSVNCMQNCWSVTSIDHLSFLLCSILGSVVCQERWLQHPQRRRRRHRLRQNVGRHQTRQDMKWCIAWRDQSQLRKHTMCRIWDGESGGLGMRSGTGVVSTGIFF